jgi:hypothetical protein
VFVRPEVDPHTRLRRALDRGNLSLAELTARECERLNLEDSLRLCLLMQRERDQRFERTAVKWLGRFLAERPGMGLDLARQALEGLANMAGTAPDAGRSQLAVVLRAVGEARAADAVLPLEP